MIVYLTDVVDSVKGRPHYYSSKKEEFAQMRFDLDAGISYNAPLMRNQPINDWMKDLSPLFNWNTKQLFVYVYASYSSSDNPLTSLNPHSETVIWDTIIQAPESPYSFSNLRERFFPSSTATGKRKGTASGLKNKNKKKDVASGVLRLRGQRSKYQIGDITGKLAERSGVTLSVGWNVQPWVGALWWSPRSGAIPRTAGTAGSSKPFDFPQLKGSNRTGASSGAAADGQAR